jgi:hypothetical protein
MGDSRSQLSGQPQPLLKQQRLAALEHFGLGLPTGPAQPFFQRRREQANRGGNYYSHDLVRVERPPGQTHDGDAEGRERHQGKQRLSLFSPG